jgi:hypothetical protein
VKNRFRNLPFKCNLQRYTAVTALLARELGWGRRRAARELADAKQFLTTFRV